jgi:hypothetical protein
MKTFSTLLTTTALLNHQPARAGALALMTCLSLGFGLNLHAQSGSAQSGNAQAANAQALASPPAVTRSSATPANRADSERDALAIAALRALISAPPERAVPLLEKTLRNSTHSERVKERALFVLGQMESEQAVAVIATFAQITTSKDLRQHAIRSLGINGSVTGVRALTALFPKLNADDKTQVIQALLIADAKPELLALAKANPNDSAGEAAVNALAAIGAKTELRALSDSGIQPKNLIQAYAISGDLESLLKVVRTEKNVDTQGDAIRSIGIIDSKAATEALLALYRELSSQTAKHSVLDALMIQNRADALLTLYRNGKSTQEKAHILKVLGRLDSDAALDAIDAALEGKTP